MGGTQGFLIATTFIFAGGFYFELILGSSEKYQIHILHWFIQQGNDSMTKLKGAPIKLSESPLSWSYYNGCHFP